MTLVWLCHWIYARPRSLSSCQLEQQLCGSGSEPGPEAGAGAGDDEGFQIFENVPAHKASLLVYQQ